MDDRDKLKAAMLVLGELYFNHRMMEDELVLARQRNEILEREVNRAEANRIHLPEEEGAGNEE